MKRFLLLLFIGAWLAGGVWAETNTVVTLKLKDGTQLEGTVLEENEQELVVLVSYAGGTITQKQTFQRDAIAEIVPVPPEELERRAMEQAYENARRYQLDPSTSYGQTYYEQVIDDVLRPFLEKYPNSSHADEIAQQLAQWRAEWKQVTAGQVKYKGRWMPAAEARQIIEREQSTQLLAQARALMQRRQYERAIATVEVLSSAEAKQLMADAYQQWITGLDTERQNLASEIDKLRQTANAGAPAAAPKKPITPLQLAKDVSTGSDSSSAWKGPSAEEMLAQNKANAQRQAAAQQLTDLQARLAIVDRDLARANNGARRNGVVIQTGGAPGSTTAKNQDQIRGAQAPVAARDNADNPQLLQQIGEFFTKYWMPVVLVVLLALWFFSRKMSH